MQDHNEMKKSQVGRSLVAQVLRGDLEVIEKLASEWRELCDKGPYAQPFYRPEWFAAYAHAFDPGKGLFAVTVRVDGRLCAVLPLVEDRASFDGLPVRKLRTPRDFHYPRFDLVHGADLGRGTRGLEPIGKHS